MYFKLYSKQTDDDGWNIHTQERFSKCIKVENEEELKKYLKYSETYKTKSNVSIIGCTDIEPYYIKLDETEVNSNQIYELTEDKLNTIVKNGNKLIALNKERINIKNRLKEICKEYSNTFNTIKNIDIEKIEDE